MKKRKSSVDRKAEIIAVTLDLAFEVGPDHVTTGMIAGRIGLTQPAMYKHFPKKQDIWLAVSEVLCAQIASNAQIRLRPDQNPLEGLRQLFMGHLHLVAEKPALPEIMVTRDPTGALTLARLSIQAAMGKFRSAIVQEFERARGAGHVRTGLRSEDGVTLLFGIIQSLMLRLIVTRDATTLVSDGERLLDLQLSLFAGKGDET